MIANQTLQTLRMLGRHQFHSNLQRLVGRTTCGTGTTTSIFLRGGKSNLPAQTSSYHKDGSANDKHTRRHHRTISSKSSKDIIESALQKPAGPLYKHDIHDIIAKDNTGSTNNNDDDHASTTLIEPGHSDFFIPEVSLHENDGRKKHRVLV